MIRTSVVVALLAALVPFVDVLFATPQERKPRKVAFLVGVGKFLHDLPNLGGAPERDVDELERVLKGHGFEVVKLTDEKAGKDEVEGRFKKLLAGDGDRKNALGRGDVLLVAVCSHGFTFEVNGKTEPFVAGYDAVPNKPADMIALNGLIDASKDYGASKLFLVDACREETDPNRGQARNVGIGGTQVTLPQNTAVLFSCKKGQLSHQPESLRHGLFTFAVLRALKGESGLRGEVTVADLVSNVGKSFRSEEFLKHVPAGRVQTPVSASGEGDDVALLTLGPVVAAKKPADPPPVVDMAKKDVLPGEVVEEFEYIVNDTEAKTGKRRVVSLDLGGGVKMEMVRITPGKFTMGSPAGEKERSDDETSHEVTLTRAYYLGKYEVTQAQYEQMMGTNPSKFKGARLPVETVSYDDAVAFCKKLSEKVRKPVELPSEAQWEFACRAGTSTPFHFGSKLNGDHANHDGNYPYGTQTKGKYHVKTMAVGSYKENGFGLFDMHGNVWEWCQDFYGPYDKVPGGNNPIQLTKQSDDRRVVRGGSWGNFAWRCRAAYRSWVAPGGRINYNGFRVCLPLD